MNVSQNTENEDIKKEAERQAAFQATCQADSKNAESDRRTADKCGNCGCEDKAAAAAGDA